jgi:DNA-binding MarR family transcriptional regulator
MTNQDVEHDRILAFWSSLGMKDLLSMEVASSLMRSQSLVWNRIDEALKPLDLNVTRFLALTTIMALEPECRLSDVSAAVLIHPATATMVVDQLTKRGLVARRSHPTDRRSTLVVSTPAGRALAREAMAKLDEINAGVPKLKKGTAERLVQLLNELRMQYGDSWPRIAAGSDAG